MFRKRIIRKEEIESYGIEKYKGKYVAGERIRLFCKKGNYKFHTTQLESIEKIKQFVKGKKVKQNAFKKEEIGNLVAIVFCILLVLSPVLYQKYLTSNEGEIEAIGIPAKININLKIINDKGNNIEFTLEEYKNYLFTVDRKNTPKNIHSTNKELVVIIDNKEYAQELSKENHHVPESEKPRVIPVDEIMILENREPINLNSQ